MARQKKQKVMLLEVVSEGRTLELTLPATVGSSVQSDLMVNSKALSPIAILLFEKNGVGFASRLEDGSMLTHADLLHYGLKMRGVTSQGAGVLRKIFARERHWSTSLPRLPRRFVMGGMHPVLRLGALIFVAASAGLVYQNLDEKWSQNSDLSAVPRTLEFGALESTIFGNSRRHTQNPAGAIFHVQAGESEQGKAARLSFLLTGKDSEKKITVLINSQEIFASNIDENCVREPCQEHVMIPSGILTAGLNVLEFRHQGKKEESQYLIGKILLGTLEELSTLERRQVVDMLDDTRNLYETRKISPANLVRAARFIERVEQVAAGKFLDAELRIEADLLAQKVRAAQEELSEDFWYRVERAIQLRDFRGARQLLGEMKIHFPNASYPQHQRILDTLESLSRL